MRISRMRVASASVLGAALLVVASPAYAADGPTTASPTPCASPSATAAAATTTTTTAGSTPSTDPSAIVNPSATPTATTTPTDTVTPTPTSTSGACGAAGGAGDATATPSTGATTTAPSATASPTGIVIPGIGEIDIKKDCEIFNSFSPVKVPCDAQITGLDSFVPNPLLLTATCGSSGPDWKITNTGTKALGFGWIDINLGGGVATIAAGETQTLNSHSIAVIATPWDAETSTLLVAVPAVGYSTCPGAPAAPVATTAPLPAAGAAAGDAVVATPHFTG